MISVSYIVLINFFSLFVCGSTQYYGYPYPYSYGNARTSYPVSTQNYGYRSSPCRSSCNSYCQYLPCSNNYAQQHQPYYEPYANYNSRQYTSPYYNFYGNSRRSADPYAKIPVEIIDDDSMVRHRSPTNARTNYQDEYAHVPVEIIDDDNPGDFWKKIPILSKTRTSSHSNYTVTKGEVTSNTATQSKPIKAVITRTFQPVRQSRPDVHIDFGSPLDNTGGERGYSVNEEKDTNKITTGSEEETTEVTTEPEELVQREDEEVSSIREWFS